MRRRRHMWFLLGSVAVFIAAAALLCGAALAGPRTYKEFIGGDNAFGGTASGVTETTTGRAHSLSLARDSSDPSGERYLASGTWESGALNLGVDSPKWITSIASSASVPASTTLGIEHSVDGGAYSSAPIPSGGLKARSVRLRVSFASDAPTATPVLGGVAISFSLAAPKPSKPPKSSGGSGGGGGTGARGSGSGSSWGTHAGGWPAGLQGGGPASSTTSGTGTGAGSTSTGLGMGTGQPSEYSQALVPFAAAPDPTVRGIVLTESDALANKTQGASAEKAAETRQARGLRVGIPGLAFVYSAGFTWAGLRSGIRFVNIRGIGGWLGKVVAGFSARFKTEV